MGRVSGLPKVTQLGRGRGSVEASPRSKPVHLTHAVTGNPIRFLNTECRDLPRDLTGLGLGPQIQHVCQAPGDAVLLGRGPDFEERSSESLHCPATLLPVGAGGVHCVLPLPIYWEAGGMVQSSLAGWQPRGQTVGLAEPALLGGW